MPQKIKKPLKMAGLLIALVVAAYSLLSGTTLSSITGVVDDLADADSQISPGSTTQSTTQSDAQSGPPSANSTTVKGAPLEQLRSLPVNNTSSMGGYDRELFPH